MTFTHIAFSDDSKHYIGRYNSLGFVSLNISNIESMTSEISSILKDSGISNEFKWEKVTNAKYRFAALKLIDFVFQNKWQFRIDTLIWDLEDSRHKNITGRDDAENLVRMYYHLASTTCSKRWNVSQACWAWYPDEQSSVDWETLQDCVRNKKHSCVQDLFRANPDFERVNLKNVKPSESHKHPLIQLADLFAGMGSYSWGHFDRFIEWNKNNSQQQSFFDNKQSSFSKSEEERFVVISEFNKKCKERSMQIGLESTSGFKSYNPRVFVNFWLYEPQHKLDKAPIRSR